MLRWCFILVHIATFPDWSFINQSGRRNRDGLLAHRQATSFEAWDWPFFKDPKSVLSSDSLKFVHPLLDRGPRSWKIVNFTTIMTQILKGFPGFYEVARLWASSPSVGYLLWSLQCEVIQWFHTLTDNFTVIVDLVVVVGFVLVVIIET